MIKMNQYVPIEFGGQMNKNEQNMQIQIEQNEQIKQMAKIDQMNQNEQMNKIEKNIKISQNNQIKQIEPNIQMNQNKQKSPS